MTDIRSKLPPRSGNDNHGQGPRRPRGSTYIVRFATILGIGLTLILFAGFTYGSYAAFGGTVSGGLPAANQQKTAARETKSTAANTVQIVALGDSLTHGLGDASGQGYVGDLSQQYRQSGVSVIQSNLGIDGLTSSGLVSELRRQDVQNLLAGANVILLSIGGNDLNNAAGLPNIDPKRIALAKFAFSANLLSILHQIRAVNKTATIALIGLYNPYGNVASERLETDTVVEDWDVSEVLVAAQFSNVVVVQTYDLFALHPAKYLYVDHFHPNQAGYQRIAERLWQDLR